VHIDISSELVFKTARSGGSGGQNVNKVETMVEAYWQLENSQLVTDAQKLILAEKLANRINKNGEVLVKSQVHRSQLGNKAEVIKKINELVNKALVVKKARIASKPSKAAKERRIQSKRQLSEKKTLRGRIDF